MHRPTLLAAAAAFYFALTPLGAVSQEPELADPVGETIAPWVEPVEQAAPVTESLPKVAGKRTAGLVIPIPPACCPIEVVDVRTTLSARRMMRRGCPPINVSACVDNPVDCCPKLYEVPFCVPCCCVGPPRVCNARPGILPGRGKVDVVWDCGFVATVTFLKHGGVIITYSAG